MLKADAVQGEDAEDPGATTVATSKLLLPKFQPRTGRCGAYTVTREHTSERASS